MEADQELEAIGYDENGNPFEVKPEVGIDNVRLCAKVVFDLITESKSYYLKVTYNGHLYDPYAVLQSYSYRHIRNWELKRVSAVVFETYKKYLESHNKFYFVNAEREYNDQPTKR